MSPEVLSLSDSLPAIIANAKKHPIKINKVSQTKTPAKYLIISIDNKDIPNAISAIYIMYFQVSLISLMASDTTDTADVAVLRLDATVEDA